MKTNIKKPIALLFCMILISVSLFTANLSVSAAGFSGKGSGTKSSPYLVTNAQQLDEMRNNLKAYYKLANTIDMSSVANFKPIGNIAKPFTGTFTCDTNSEGTPKYIIKNLKITVSPAGATRAEKYSGYKKDGTSGWECGLFGKAKGATFKNIFLGNINYKNTVEGTSTMNGDYSINPGQDEMGIAALVVLGEGINVTNCGASGNIEGACNHTGGLIGYAGSSSKIKNSYSYVNVKSTGLWQSGGFIATINKSTVDSCFYEGTFHGGGNTAGAFFGAGKDATVSNCWAGGTVTNETSGCFGGTKNLNYSDYIEPYKYTKNCYTIAKIAGRTNSQTNKTTAANNWITNEPGGLEIGFAAGSMEEINNAFKSLSAWTVTAGTYPQLKNVFPVKDANKYAPLSAEQVQQNNTSDTASTGGKSDTDNTAADNKTDNSKDEDGKNSATIKTQVKTETPSIAKTEIILIVVLSVFFVLVMGLTVYILISNILFIRKCKAGSVNTSLTDFETDNGEGKNEKS